MRPNDYPNHNPPKAHAAPLKRQHLARKTMLVVFLAIGTYIALVPILHRLSE